MNTGNTTATASAKPRIAWIDFAKGFCIFMVVMLHTTHHIELDRDTAQSWIDHVVAFAQPFRMPDFFLISGLFLGAVIDRPWKRYLDTKVVHFYYFYLLWLGILFAATKVRESALYGWPLPESLPYTFVLELVNPSYPLWFIHSLPIYFVLTRLIKNIPWWSVWIVVAVLQMSDIKTGNTVIDQFCLRYVYFYSGYVFAKEVFKLSDWALDNRKGAVLYLVVWAVLEQYFVSQGWSKLPGISLVLGYLGAVAVVFFACLMCKFKWMDWLRYLGEHSIVVYLSFLIPMMLCETVLDPIIPDTGTLVLLTTIGAVGGSVLIFWAVQNNSLSFLFRRPSWARLKTSSDLAYKSAET